VFVSYLQFVVKVGEMKKKKERIVNKEKESMEEEIRHMLEFYTKVPPFPGTVRQKRKLRSEE
jgi:hypothetical protein